MNGETTRVLVTGASSGIGRATALAFAREGAEIVATARRADRLAELRRDPAGAGRITAIAGDIDDDAFRARLVAEAGAVDVLVNAAGALRHAPFLESDPADWEPVLRTNVLSLLALTQRVARGMCERRRGHIFNISSVLARQVYPYTLVYAATKFAVRAICLGLRIELHPYGVKVTEVAPGLTATEVFEGIEHPVVRAAYANRGYPPLAAEDIARAIVAAAASGPNVCPQVIEINPMGQV